MTRLISKTIVCTILALPSALPAAHNPAGSPATPKLELAQGPSARISVATSRKVPNSAQSAWSTFQLTAGKSWKAQWDSHTGIPLRIYGAGLPAPGTIGDQNIAQSHATTVLKRYLTLLAPGTTIDQFLPLANEVHRGVRTVSFKQTFGGLPVIGGQVSFRYKADRLVVIGSEAFPLSTKAPPIAPSNQFAPMATATMETNAERWIVEDRATTATSSAVSLPAILPLIRGADITYRTVVAVTVDSQNTLGKWRVYVDAFTGERVAREQTLLFGSGTINYNVPVRQPLQDRSLFPPADLAIIVDSNTINTDSAGQVTWPGVSDVNVELGVTGPLVRVRTAIGSPLVGRYVLRDGSDITLDKRDDEIADAQLSAFIHAGVVKEFVRALNPNLSWLDTQLPVNVNLPRACNAFSDGNSINFFLSSGSCGNTALLADVVYHEFGHSMHVNSIIEGAGSFDSAFSEGLSDYLAASITGDPKVGVGFFNSDIPLRHIDPLDQEYTWPDDVGGVHKTGRIFSGAMWDLRKLLIIKYGTDLGVSMANRYFYSAVQRASNIPSTYIEILLEDDDDGNLANGTPNICDINTSFGAHGLRQFNIEIKAPATAAPSEDGYAVAIDIPDQLPQCPGDAAEQAIIDWTLREEKTEGAEILMDPDGSSFVGTIPPAAEGDVVEFQMSVDFVDGTTQSFPENRADDQYQLYVGDVVELYCTNFETDPFLEGWIHGKSTSASVDDWSWGALNSPPASNDPLRAYSGTSVVGNDISDNGTYAPNSTNFLLSPVINVNNYTDIHLQYRRWLDVEDGNFDRATIYSNDRTIWTNFNSAKGNQSTVHHTDREWRFHDVPLIGTQIDSSVQIKFELASDGGLQRGGWTIDNFCIVANPNVRCGDSIVAGAEECDLGPDNSDSAADTCRTSCLAPVCGDGVVDTAEVCDDGNTEDGDGCGSSCLVREDNYQQGDCGCSVARSRPWSQGSSAVAMLTFLGIWGLRRTARRGDAQ